MTAYWLGVASREHVRKAVEGGFCQLNHGREAPLKRLRPGDRIVYYSPREGMRAGAAVQSFTAVGEVMEGEPYSVDGPEGGSFYRRAVRYETSEDIPIQPLLPQLSFSRGGGSWGQALRRGTLQITAEDYAVIVRAGSIGSQR